jgi:hypothetical protein
MSFYVVYPNRKDHRRPYRDSRKNCAACCNHCSCTYCRDGRLFAGRRRIPIDLKEYLYVDDYNDIINT